MNKKKSLSKYEQETIINFNKEESMTSIFTYEKTWQKKLEGMGYKPDLENDFGGKGYTLPKSRIKPPRFHRNQFSGEKKASVTNKTKKELTKVSVS